MNRRSLCVDLFGTVDMTAFTSLTQRPLLMCSLYIKLIAKRTPVTEKLNAEKKEVGWGLGSYSWC